MKKLIIVITSFLISLGSAVALPDQKACFDVQGMTCAACGLTVKTAVKKLGGIKDISVSVEDKNATVLFDPVKTNVPNITQKITSVGYTARELACKPKG